MSVKLAKRPGKFLKPRIVLNADPGWGKTTTLAQTKNPAIIMADNETGYDVLLGAGLVPSHDATVVSSWTELLEVVNGLKGSDYETVGLDALSGMEQLCHKHVCQTQFGGDWSDKGFCSFMQGYDASARVWRELLQALDAINAEGKMVLMLSHSHVKPYRNPVGPDYDQFVPDCHRKTWSPTAKWADAVFFGTFHHEIQKEKGGRAKGLGGDIRVLHTRRSDAFEAKNRWNMEPVIYMPDDYTQMWSTISKAIHDGISTAKKGAA